METCEVVKRRFPDAPIVLWSNNDVEITREDFGRKFAANTGGTNFACALKHVGSKIETAVVLTDGAISDVETCRSVGFNRNAKFIFYLWNQEDLSIPAACLGGTANLQVLKVDATNPVWVERSMYTNQRTDPAKVIRYLEQITARDRLDIERVRGYAFEGVREPLIRNAIWEMNARLVKEDATVYSVEQYEAAPDHVCSPEVRDLCVEVRNIMIANRFSSINKGVTYRPMRVEMSNSPAFTYEDAIMLMESNCMYLLVNKTAGSPSILYNRPDLVENPLMILMDNAICEQVRSVVEYHKYSKDTIARLPLGISPFTKLPITNLFPLKLHDRAFNVAAELFLGQIYSGHNVLWHLVILSILNEEAVKEGREGFENIISGLLTTQSVALNLPRNIEDMSKLVTVQAFLVDCIKTLKKVPYTKVIELLKISGYDVAKLGNVHERIAEKYLKDNNLCIEPEVMPPDSSPKTRCITRKEYEMIVENIRGDLDYYNKHPSGAATTIVS